MGKASVIELAHKGIRDYINNKLEKKAEKEKKLIAANIHADEYLKEISKEQFNQWSELKLALVSVIEKRSPVEHPCKIPTGMKRGTHDNFSFFAKVNGIMKIELDYEEFYQEFVDEEYQKAIQGIVTRLNAEDVAHIYNELYDGKRAEEIVKALEEKYDLD